MAESWTLAEAALIVEKPLEAVQRTVERGPLKPQPGKSVGEKSPCCTFTTSFTFMLSMMKESLNSRR